MTSAIVNIGQLVTIERASGDLKSFDDCSLVFENGSILEIVRNLTPQVDEIINADRQVVVPGFVDAHTHLIFGGNRSNELKWKSQGMSYKDIAERGGGIWSTVQQTRNSTEEELYQIGLKHLSWCIRNGTTTLESKSGYGLDLQTELHLLLALHKVDSTFCETIGESFGQRIHSTFLGLHALPPEFSSREDYVTHMIDDVLPVIANAGLASSVDAFVEHGYFDHDVARNLAAKAKSLGLGLRLHVDQLSDNSGAKLAAELNANTADHLEHTPESGIEALVGSDTQPVLLPASVFGIGSHHYPNARYMIESGLEVVLATDFNPGSSPTPSIPFVMALAVRFMKMMPAECLAATTLNAAKSLGINDRGTLEQGMKADFSIWPISDWEEIPNWICGPRPSEVWASGRKVI